jgi:hypothetical protein
MSVTDPLNRETPVSLRKVRAAARVARFNGWAAALCAALSLPFALFSFTALLLVLGLAAVAWNEFRGRQLLLRFDPRGARLLGLGQLGLMGMLVAYCVWSLYAGLSGTTELDSLLREIEPLLGSIPGLRTKLLVSTYGTIIVGTLLFQGLNALYYFARVGHVESCLRSSPHSPAAG